MLNRSAKAKCFHKEQLTTHDLTKEFMKEKLSPIRIKLFLWCEPTNKI